MSLKERGDSDHLQASQLRGLLLLLGICALLLGLVLWRNYSPPAHVDDIPPEVMADFNRIVAKSDTTPPPGRSYKKNSQTREKQKKNKKNGKASRKNKKSDKSQQKPAAQRDITTEDLSQ